MMLTTFQPPYPPSPTEIGILVVLTLSFLVTIIHKIASNTVMFLLQPCHVSAGLLIAVMMWPDKRSPIPHLLLNVYLHTAWGYVTHPTSWGLHYLHKKVACVVIKHSLLEPLLPFCFRTCGITRCSVK